MAEGIYGTFVHGDERGHDHAEGDDGEQQEILDGADDEIVQSEAVHPVCLAQGCSADAAVGQSDVDGELQPDNLSDDAGK